MEGSIAGLRGGAAVGWAWDPEGPDDAATVEVLVDGEVVASGRAGVMRRGLLTAGKGNGRHGFRIALPAPVLDGRKAVLSARVAPDGPELAGSGRTVALEPPKGRAAVPAGADFSGAPPNGKAMALLGREDWLFLCNRRTMEQVAGRSRLSDSDLETYEEAFRARVELLQRQGVPYIFTAVPMKELMHRELLPPGFPVTAEPTPWEQVLSVAARVPGLHIVDLRGVLAAAMADEQVYFRTDHHTNLLGSYHVYRELLLQASRYRSDLAPRERSEFAYEHWPDWRGDMSEKEKATLRDGVLVPLSEEESGPAERWDERVMRHATEPLRARLVTEVPETHEVSGSRPTRIYEVDDPTLPTAVIVRDSFAEQVVPFLAEHFRRSVFTWVPNPPFDVIELEQPDIVLHLMAERFLIRAPLIPGSEAEAERRAQASEAATLRRRRRQR